MPASLALGLTPNPVPQTVARSPRLIRLQSGTSYSPLRAVLFSFVLGLTGLEPVTFLCQLRYRPLHNVAFGL